MQLVSCENVVLLRSLLIPCNTIIMMGVMWSCDNKGGMFLSAEKSVYLLVMDYSELGGVLLGPVVMLFYLWQYTMKC